MSPESHNEYVMSSESHNEYVMSPASHNEYVIHQNHTMDHNEYL